MPDVQVILAEDDVLVRDVLRHVLAQQEVAVVGEPESSAELRETTQEFPSAVVVMGNRLDGSPIDELMTQLEPDQRAVVVTAEPVDRLATLLSESLRGYLMHDASPDEVVTGILAVARGGAALNGTAAAMVLEEWRDLQLNANPAAWRGRALLTPRETEVLEALADGLATKQIALRLGVANKTVENHKLRIFDKLGVHTQAHAVMVAMRQGIVPALDGDNGDGETPGADES